MTTFILNDENVKNSYGFFVRNSGGKFERFLANPAMLHNHDPNKHTGKWDNFRVEANLIKADPNFNLKTSLGKEISESVADDYLKGASMGILIDSDTSFERQLNGEWWCVSWELTEASTCPVPSNASALKLFDAKTGKELKSEGIALCLSQLEQDFQISNKNSQMEKNSLSIDALKALGLSTQPATAIELDQQIMGLATKLKDSETGHNATKLKLEELAEAQAESLVSTAVLSGKITAGEKESWKKMAKENLSIASSALAKIPAKRNLSHGIETPEGEEGEKLPKNADEFFKLSATEQKSFIEKNPIEYKELWAKK